jgi:hypothetical protein
MNPEQISYVRAQLQAGTTEAELVETLRANGYAEDQIALLLQSAREGGQAEIVRVLPSFSVLIKTAVTHTALAKYLVAFYFAGFVLQYYATFVLESTDTPALPEFIMAIGAMLGSWVFLLVLSIVTIQSFARLSTGQQFSVHFQHAWPIFLSVWWVIILTVLVLFGGLMLFVIPGIILFVYLTFTLQARIIENYRGFAALNRSIQIVKGHWWSVALKGFGATIIGLLVSIIGGGGIGIVLGLTMVPQDTIALIADFGVGPLFGALYAVFIHSVIVQMYMSLLPTAITNDTTSFAQPVPAASNTLLYFFAIAGLIIIPLTAFILSSLSSSIQHAERAMVSTQKSSATMSLLLLQRDAEIYLFNNEYSYKGFCDTVPTEVECLVDDFNYRFVTTLIDGSVLCLSSLHPEYEVEEVAQITKDIFTCQ